MSPVEDQPGCRSFRINMEVSPRRTWPGATSFLPLFLFLLFFWNFLLAYFVFFIIIFLFLLPVMLSSCFIFIFFCLQTLLSFLFSLFCWGPFLHCRFGQILGEQKACVRQKHQEGCDLEATHQKIKITHSCDKRVCLVTETPGISLFLSERFASCLLMHEISRMLWRWPSSSPLTAGSPSTHVPERCVPVTGKCRDCAWACACTCTLKIEKDDPAVPRNARGETQDCRS